MDRVPNLSRKEKESYNRSGYMTQVEIKIASFLRVMAGGSVIDVGIAFDIGESAVYQYFESVLGILERVLSLAAFPKSELQLQLAAIDFSTSRPMPNPLPGCIAAVDGIAIPILKPPESMNPLNYYCRKGFFSIAVQAIVDARYRFIAISAVCTGATHDSTALSVSNIGRYLQDGNLKKGYWIAGDEAYVCSDSLITPFARSFKTKFLDSFNYYQSSHRIHVEQTFGQWISKWRILKSTLSLDMEKNSRVIVVAAMLHNFCIMNGDGVEKKEKDYAQREQSRKELISWLKSCNGIREEDPFDDVRLDEVDGGARAALGRSEVRRLMVELLGRGGIVRPAWARSG